MKKPLKYNAVAELAASHPQRASFGAGTQYFCLPFELEGSEPALAPWLRGLPCPVIGIGKGALASACDVVLDDDRKLPTIVNNVKAAEMAAMVLVQHLRASETLPLLDAITAESFAYSTIQKGPEFLNWLSAHDARTLPPSNQTDVLINSDGKTLTLTLNRLDTRNAIGTEMRDAICEALDLAIMDQNITRINLTGRGATFSTGGAIEEFGKVSDPASAHWIRSLCLPAQRLAQLGDKLHIHVNGAAIGAGAEIAAFGGHVTASSKAWFQLPELKYGLIPGAGGTASLPRRIGRQKTAYMALSMDKIRADTALKWGLIDGIID